MKPLNPFFVYIFSWIIVVVLYYFNWSSMYPSLKFPLVLFLGATAFVSWCISKRAYNDKMIKVVKLPSTNMLKKIILWYTIITYILLIAEFIGCGGIPLFLYSSNIMSGSSYSQWGIKGINVFVINSFGVIFSLCMYFSLLEKKDRKFWIFYMILSFIPSIICVQRGDAMYKFFAAIIMYLSFNPNKKKILGVIVSSFVVLYFFGVIGNIRSGIDKGKGNEDLYAKTWEANDKFEKTKLPYVFFWSYVYATSPLANLQNAIDKKHNFDYSIEDAIIKSIIPQVFAKYMEEHNDAKKYYVHPTLVVCTTYIYFYLHAGWGGMFIMYFYIIGFIMAILKISQKMIFLKVPIIVCLCQIVFFSIFDCMVNFMGLIPQLLLYYMLDIYLKKKNNKIKTLINE